MQNSDLYLKAIRKRFKKINKEIKKTIKQIDLSKEEKQYLKNLRNA